MRKSLKLLGVLLIALLAVGVAGCGKKLANIEQINAEYRIASMVNHATDKLYPNKPQAMELEQVYIKWSIIPARDITVGSMSFTVKLFDETLSSAIDDFTIDVVVNTFDTQTKEIVTKTQVSAFAVTFGNSVEIDFNGGVLFSKEIPKDKKESCTIDILFHRGGEANNSVKFTLTELALNTL